MSLIYLASPYSKYPEGRQKAYELVCKKAAKLMLEGHTIFCPIAHSHPIEEFGMGGKIQEGDFWLNQDFAVLYNCVELWVYKMPGWDNSYGVAKEIEFAKKLRMIIKYLEWEENVLSTV